MAYIGNSYNTQLVTPAIDYFNGNGVTTTFTLSRPVLANAGMTVVVNNVVQNPVSAYAINASNQIVFTGAPSTGTNNVYCQYNEMGGQLGKVGQGQVGTNELGSVNNVNSIGNNLTLQTNGVTAIVVGQNGKIGIGRTVPTTFEVDILSDPLGTVAGLQSPGLRFESSDSPAANVGSLEVTDTRTRNGGNWESRGWRLQQKVDNSYMAYIQFNGGYTAPNGGGISIGAGVSTVAPQSVLERFKIDGEGRVTTPYQPMFYARGSEANTTLTALMDLPFNNAVQNTGGHYNTGNYRFTAPVAGNYLFTWSFFINGTPTGRATLKINGGSYNNLQMDCGGAMSQAAIIKMNPGDYASVGDWQSTAGQVIYMGHSHFSGILLG